MSHPPLLPQFLRIFEKLYNKVVTGAREGGEKSMKYRIFRWVLEVGQEVSALKQRGLEPKETVAFEKRCGNKIGLLEASDSDGWKT